MTAVRQGGTIGSGKQYISWIHVDDFNAMIRHVMENDAFRQSLLDRIPLGRIADPKDVVGPALFFAAPASGFVTGQNLFVDGGITASQ